MGRSVSYATGSQVVTFKTIEPIECHYCDGTGKQVLGGDSEPEYEEDCSVCGGWGVSGPDSDDFDMLIDDFRDRLRVMFPSVVEADDWIGREDHVLAENKLARFGMSEYCGLVSYWIVPKESGYYSDDQIEPLAKRWVASIADKFVAAFGELTKVGSFSNGEGVYRRIDR